jgi:hypothetical protein
MRDLLRRLSLFIVVFFVWGGLSAVFAVTPLKIDNNVAPKGDSVAAVRVKRVAGVIKTLDDSKLTLQNGRKFSLNGVKVIGSRRGKKAKAGGLMADMMFVNDRLVEVVVK